METGPPKGPVNLQYGRENADFRSTNYKISYILLLYTNFFIVLNKFMLQLTLKIKMLHKGVIYFNNIIIFCKFFIKIKKIKQLILRALYKFSTEIYLY